MGAVRAITVQRDFNLFGTNANRPRRRRFRDDLGIVARHDPALDHNRIALNNLRRHENLQGIVERRQVARDSGLMRECQFSKQPGCEIRVT